MKDRFKMETGETDHVRKSATLYAEGREKWFRSECFTAVQSLRYDRLKPKALIRRCQNLFDSFISKLKPEIEAAHIIGELSMCERIYQLVMDTPQKEVDWDFIVAELQLVMVHVQNETIEKCNLPESLKVDLEALLKRDGFYKDKCEIDTSVNYAKIPTTN